MQCIIDIYGNPMLLAQTQYGFSIMAATTHAVEDADGGFVSAEHIILKSRPVMGEAAMLLCSFATKDEALSFLLAIIEHGGEQATVLDFRTMVDDGRFPRPTEETLRIRGLLAPVGARGPMLIAGNSSQQDAEAFGRALADQLVVADQARVMRDEMIAAIEGLAEQLGKMVGEMS